MPGFLNLLKHELRFQQGNRSNASEIKNHPFFDMISWKSVELEELQPPIVPPPSFADYHICRPTKDSNDEPETDSPRNQEPPDFICDEESEVIHHVL